MFDPFEDEEASGEPPRPPFPTPMVALMLTFGASLAAIVIALVFFERLDLLAVGVGEALGVGLVATLAARRVPEPQAERLGLQGFAPRLIPALICIVPIVFLTSELDNVGRSIDGWMPPLALEEALVVEPPATGEETSDATTPATGDERSDATPVAPDEGSSDTETPIESLDDAAIAEALAQADALLEEGAGPSDDATAPLDLEPPEGFALLQVAIVRLGISPVVQGFLFFGVILQGVVTWLGRTRGLLLTACLYSLIHAFAQAPTDPGLFRAVAAIVSSIGVGLVLGIARLSTGSVLAPILLDTALKAVGLFAWTSPAVFAVRGYNVGPDAHTPIVVLIPSLIAVAWGLRVLVRQNRGAW